LVSDPFIPEANYAASRKAVGYVPRLKATQADYDRVGFKAGLEVHQQLKTHKKLFCNCPAGNYNRKGEYDAEIIRHMRPTLSELGEYDGTALMEFKTRKQIIYQIKNETACTYDIDDTPPFPMNREALEIALEIALLCRLNIVGEVHIIRKQYLDGSIPTGFQRTAILGVEGEIQLKHKKVRIIQLSLEEDSCREVSDVGHVRVYQTDRLGMPLIETVTYPDFAHPDEVREGADYIRFLSRSTNKVFTGIGAGREDVNVSCRGGTRVEIKGVAHTRWIPELTHNEVFRQWSLLCIRDLLKDRIPQEKEWKTGFIPIDPELLGIDSQVIKSALEPEYRFMAVNLPRFQGILSHFTQPGKMFADELSDRLKVIACIEKPNMIHSESIEPLASAVPWNRVRRDLKAADGDAQLLIWGPAGDIPTALETVEERCRLAFLGVPRESRKSFADGTTVFERVLPGPNRMYPDTDSVPIPLDDAFIEKIRRVLPEDVSAMMIRMQEWGLPPDVYPYILSRNLFPLMKRIVEELEVEAKFMGTLLGHTLKHVEGRHPRSPGFAYTQVYDLIEGLQKQGLDLALAREMLVEIYRHPQMDIGSILAALKFKPMPESDIMARVPYLWKIAEESGISRNSGARTRWMMGELRPAALGNMPLARLHGHVQDINSGDETPSGREGDRA
jgi:glutamyl-tRNA(Gln) amidotransferase subunit E